MSSPADRPGRRLAVRGLLAAVAALAVVPAYLAVDLSWRATAVRVAGAAVVWMATLRVLRAAGRGIGSRPASPLDARSSGPPALRLDPRFRRLRDDLRSGTRRRSHFDAILWPRLVALGGDAALPRPAGRSALDRRGPSLAAIEKLVARIEERS